MSDPDVAALAPVDQARLTARLAEVVDLGGPLEVAVLSGGRSNLTYIVRSGPHDYVVRRRPLGPVAPGAHDMAREHRVLRALQGSGLPVPPVYGYFDDDTCVGAPFYVMGRVAGAVFHRAEDVATLTPAEARSLSDAVIDVLDRLHKVDVAAVGLAELGRPDGFVARRIGRWLEQWRRGPHRAQPMVEELAGRLSAAVPARTDNSLVHGDYRLGNLLVGFDESAGVDRPARVAAVLDWEMSTLGDPLTDLAHLLVYWEPTRGRVTHASQAIADRPGFRNGAELAARYAGRSGRDVSALPFYLAFEHWRAAIIKEAIVMRTSGASGAAGRALPPGQPLPAGPGADNGGPDDDLAASVALHLEEAADLLGPA